MPILHRVIIDEKRLAASVKRAARALAPDVVRVGYGIAPDWTGEQSLFFRVVLSDKAARPERLREVSERVRNKIWKEIKGDELGLFAYTNFRSESEQKEMNDPGWEKP
jgi:hypothetical protein